MSQTNNLLHALEQALPSTHNLFRRLLTESLVPEEHHEELFNIFIIYTPYKERYYIFNQLSKLLPVELVQAELFSLAMEVSFVSCYCKDDLIDHNTKRLKNSSLSKEQLLLYADILLSFSFECMEKFQRLNHKRDWGTGSYRSLVSMLNQSILELNLGQLQSLNKSLDSYPSIKETLHMCYLKAGALYKAGAQILCMAMSTLEAIKTLPWILEQIGTYTQVRNDIENFIINPTSEDGHNALEDLANGQANFLLSVFCERAKQACPELLEGLQAFYAKKDLNRSHQLTIFELLEEVEAVSVAIRTLNKARENIAKQIEGCTAANTRDLLKQFLVANLTIDSDLNKL